MSTSAGSIHADISLNPKDFNRGVDKIMSGLDGMSKNAEQTKKDFNSSFKSIATSAVANGNLIANAVSNVASSLASMVTSTISGADNLQRTQMKYETILGSQELAIQRMNELKDFAASTPFQIADIQKADVMLQGFGIRSQELLENIGNAAAISGAGFADLGLIIGQMSQSKDLENVKQLVERGVISFDELAAAGITRGSTGAIENSVDELYNATLSIMETKFGGGMEKLSGSLSGSWSTFLDNLSGLTSGILIDTGIMDAATDGVQKLTSGLKNLKGIFDLIVKGDYTGVLNNLGISEDSPIVDTILNLRDSFFSLGEALKTEVGQIGAWWTENFGSFEVNPIEAADTALKRLNESLDFLGTQIVPGISDVVINFGNWVRDNGKLIGWALTTIAGGIIALKVAALFDWIGQLGGLGAALGKLLTVVATKFGAVLAAAPWLLLIAGIAALIWYWPEIKEFFSNLWETVQEVFGNIVDAVTDWASNVWAQIEGFAKSVVTAVTNAFTGVAGAVTEFVTSIPQRLSEFFQAIPGMVTTFLTFIVAAIYQLVWLFILGIGAIIVGVITFIQGIPGMVVALIQMIIAFATELLVAAGQLATQFWEWLNTTITELVNAVVTFFQELPGKMQVIWNNVVEAVNNAVTAVGDFFNELKDSLLETWENIKTKAGEFIDGVVAFFTGLPGRVTQAFTDLGNFISNIPTELQNAWNSMVSSAETFFTDLGNKITENAENIKTGFVDLFESIATQVGDIFKGIINGIIDTLNSGINGVNGMLDNVPKEVRPPSIPTIPRLNKGGFLNAGSPALVGDSPNGGINKYTELFVPQTSGRVYSSDQLQELLGGGDGKPVIVNNHLHTTVADKATVDQFVKQNVNTFKKYIK